MRQRSASKGQMSSKRSYVLPLPAQRSFRRAVLLQIRCRIVKRQLSGRGIPRHSVIHSRVSMASKGKAVWPRYHVQTGHRSWGDSNLWAVFQTPWRAETCSSRESSVWAITSTATSIAGQFQGKFSYKTKTAVQTVYVVNGLRTRVARHYCPQSHSQSRCLNNIQGKQYTTIMPKSQAGSGVDQSDPQSGRTRRFCTSWENQSDSLHDRKPTCPTMAGLRPNLSQEREMWYKLLMTVNVLPVST